MALLALGGQLLPDRPLDCISEFLGAGGKGGRWGTRDCGALRVLSAFPLAWHCHAWDLSSCCTVSLGCPFPVLQQRRHLLLQGPEERTPIPPLGPLLLSLSAQAKCLH